MRKGNTLSFECTCAQGWEGPTCGSKYCSGEGICLTNDPPFTNAHKYVYWCENVLSVKLYSEYDR